jgi:hypothetical protein
MGERHWKTVAALLFILARDGFAQDSAQAVVLVAVHDSARVPPQELADARTMATRVFASAGVRVEWQASGGACPSHADEKFCVQVLLRARNSQSAPGSRRIMGMALAGDIQRAVLSLYFDAVTAVARKYGSPRGQLLGLALIHELGHVLLPPPSHSATGIMQPSWEGDDLRHVLAGDARFTEAQVLALRTRLARGQ